MQQIVGWSFNQRTVLPPNLVASKDAPAGSDPSKLVEELAKKKKKKVLGVSLGQGQDVIARKLMTLALAEGHWVLLQNAHLGLSYLAEVCIYKSKHQDLRFCVQG